MRSTNSLATVAKIKSLEEEIRILKMSKDVWRAQYRLLAQRIMRTANLPDDFSTAGTDEAFAKLAKLVTDYKKANT